MNMDLNPLDPKKKLMDALMPGGTAVDPLAQPSAGPEVGGMETMPTSIPDPLAPPKGPSGPVGGTYKTSLMEGDPGKLADKGHAAESPKYDFLQLAQQNKYDYTQMPEMLKELQSGPNARLWQGWTADGKGNFVFTGDPAQLAPEWNGAKRVDAVGAFGNIGNGGKASGWRWGVDDGGTGGAASGGAPSFGGVRGPMNSSLDPLLQGGDVMAKIQAALKQLSGPRSNAEALFAGLGGKR